MNITSLPSIFWENKNFLAKTLCMVGGTWLTYRLFCQYRSLVKLREYKKAIANFPRLSMSDSLMAKYLTPDIYAKLFSRKTSSGTTIDGLIQTRSADMAPTNPRRVNVSTGIVAGDEECYETFCEIFTPLIHEIHENFCHQDNHVSDLDFSKLGNDRLNENYVVSCCVKAVRSIRGCRLAPCMSKAERKDLARRVKYALEAIIGDIEGEYYPIGKILDKIEESCVDVSVMDLLHQPSSRFWTTSALTEGRGAWISKNFKLLVLVNMSEHVTVISTDHTGDLISIFERFCALLTTFKSNLRKLGKDFMNNQHLGNITSEISNLGTGMTVSVDVKIPLVRKDPRFHSILEKLRLQYNNVNDEMNGESLCELSNIERLGISEVEIVKTVFDGICRLIDMERRLEQGMKIDDLIVWKDR